MPNFGLPGRPNGLLMMSLLPRSEEVKVHTSRPMSRATSSQTSQVPIRTAGPVRLRRLRLPRAGIAMLTKGSSVLDALATHLVNGLIERGVIKPKSDVKELVACVVELMSANFETEAQIDEEADKMAEVEARRDTRLDVTRLRTLIRQRLAEKKNFTL